MNKIIRNNFPLLSIDSELDLNEEVSNKTSDYRIINSSSSLMMDNSFESNEGKNNTYGHRHDRRHHERNGSVISTQK